MSFEAKKKKRIDSLSTRLKKKKIASTLSPVWSNLDCARGQVP